MRSRLKCFLATGLGTGYLRPAPGSWGSALTACVFIAIALASDGSEWAVGIGLGLWAAAASTGCVAYGPFLERHFGRKDPSHCTLDEFAGQAVTFLALPLAAGGSDNHVFRWLIVMGMAFFFFRLYDIVKPFPARRMERLPLGWGVLVDDLMAGVYANLTCQLVLRLGLRMT